MKNKFDIAVSEAVKYLVRPRDIAHDLIHHQAVWENCQIIINGGKLRVDRNLVKVAAFWHDVILAKAKKVSTDNVRENIGYLKKFLPEVGFDNGEVKIILATILRHEFRDKPVNIEGLVLQDADKLDVLSRSRWERTIEAYQSGKMSEEKFISYTKTALKWIPIIVATFHFASSRRIAKKLIKNIYDYEKQLEAIRKLGLEKELEISKKEMYSLVGSIKRFLISVTRFGNDLTVWFKHLFI